MDLQQFAARVVEAYNDRDLDAMAYADDVLMVFHHHDARRYDNVHDVWQHWVREWTAFPDARATLVRVITDGTTFVAEMTWKATNTGPFVLDDDSTFPPTNQSMAQELVSICEVRDGRITRVDQYWDAISLEVAQ